MTAPWTEADNRHMAGMIAAMWPVTKILATFDEHAPADVLLALDTLLKPPVSPVDYALQILGKRATPSTRRGGPPYTVDGHPADAMMLVTTANAVLAEYEKPPIPYPAAIGAAR